MWFEKHGLPPERARNDDAAITQPVRHRQLAYPLETSIQAQAVQYVVNL